MLGIDIAESVGKPYVFLYYTEATEEDGEDLRGIEPPLGNRLYRYESVDSNNRQRQQVSQRNASA